MQNSTSQVFQNKKRTFFSCLFFVFIFFIVSSEINAQGIKSGVTFNWADNQSNLSDPATIESININGTIYNTFVVPSTYEMTRLGPGGHNGNDIQQNGTEILGSSNAPNWDSEATRAYQSLNLNHYFESNSNGDNFCGNFGAASTTNSQIQTISYSPGIPSNPDGILAVTERGGNNCQYVELYGIRSGESTESLLGRTFVRTSGDLRGVRPQAPPLGISDYWSSGRNNENNQIIGIALFKLSDIAPIGSVITSIRYLAASHDNGDGKFFLMQTYAVDDIFESEFETEFNGDVGANDNVPSGSSYTYFSSVPPFNGTLVVNTDGSFTYTPDANFVGTDVFEVQVCLPAPNQSVCNTSTVTITVKPDNLPIANDDNYTIDEDVTNNTFNVLSNDDFGLDGPQENSALAISTNPSNGNASVNDNGTPTNPLDDYIVYTPNPYFNGSDSLVYQITDANGTIAYASVDITVNPDTTKSIDITTKNITVNENVGLATVTVQIQGNYQVGPTISYRTIDNSAIAGQDYTAVSNNHTFAGNNGETFSFTVPITDDNLIELSEVLNIEVTSSSYTTPVNLSTDITIIDNDGGVGTGLFFDSSSVTVNENAGTATFTVRLSGNVAGGFTVNYDTADGSAEAGNDYDNTSGTLTFAGNDNEAHDIVVNITDDNIIEPTEGFVVNLSGISTLLIGINTPQANGNILDNDGGAGTGISFDNTNVTVNEGDGTATFNVVLAGNVAGGFTLDYATADDAAIAPNDYTANAGQLTFLGNDSESHPITVSIIDDSLIEFTERFFVDLSNLSTALISINTPQANGNILDNDGGAGTGISFDNTNVTVNEGDGTATFNVVLTGNVAGGFTLDYATDNGSAIAPGDYVANAGQLAFAGNDGESHPITVNIVDDNIIEATENFLVNLSNLSTTLISINTPQANGNIVDNDGGAGTGISFDNTNVTVNEDAGTATFNVILTGNVAGGFTLDYATDNGSAVAPGDYVANAGQLAFAGNDGESHPITVNIVDDNIIEATENFLVNLSNLSTTLISINTPQANGNIIDNDGGAGTGISFDNTNVTVNEDAGTATFNVVLTGNVAGGFTLDYATDNGSAIAPGDYVANAGQLAFAGNDGESHPITVNIVDDNIIEATENFLVNLSNLSTTLISINTPQANGNIVDNDGGAGTGISFDNTNVTVNEGDGTATFNVILAGNVSGGFTLDYATADDAAITPGDYITNSGQLTFIGNDGESHPITVTIVDDNLIEFTERFFVNLSNLSTNLISVNTLQANGNIVDNDGGAGTGISFDNTNVTVNEDAGTATFNVVLTGNVAGGFTLDYATTDDAAIAPNDYTANAGQLTFLGNDSESHPITVSIIDDSLIEFTERFFVNLSNLSTTLISINTPQANGNIVDNDGGAGTGISFDNTNVTVNEDAGTATFNVVLTGNVAGGFTLDYATDNGSAGAPGDYVANAGQLAFAGNDSESHPITVSIIDDSLIEFTERFFVNLSNLSTTLISINTPQANGNIVDNDGGAGTGISFDNTNVTVNEDAGTATFNVILTGNVAGGFTLDYATDNGSAIAPGDYVANSGQLAFAGNDGESHPITVNIVDDNIIEATENFLVNLSNLSTTLISINTPQANGNIVDNDGGINDGISFVNTNVEVTEGIGVTATFEVTLTGNFQDAFDVSFETAFGTATATDFNAQADVISFTGTDGEVQTIVVTILDDNINEPSEAYVVNLTGTTNPLVNINTPQASGTILDNDGGINDGISFVNTNVEVTEGIGVTATFEVTLTGNFQDAFNVSFETAFGTATDTDFNAQADVISFTGTDGEVQTIVVTILDDNITEPSEAYTVNLTGTTNPLVTINTPQANGSILDNDGGINDGLSFVNTNVEVTEGVGVTATFEVELTGNFQDAFDVSFETAFGTATATDFNAQADVISFAGTDGEVQTIVVTILDDNIIEPTEGYLVNLTATTNPLVIINTPQANGSILDDDLMATDGISFVNTNVEVTEGVGVTATFEVELTGNFQDAFDVSFETAFGTATATDFNAQADVISFAGTDGEVQTIVVTILDDNIIEPTEGYLVNLTATTNPLVIINTPQANGSILDDDMNPSFGVQFDVTSIDIDEAAGTVSLSVILNADVQDEFTVEYNTVDGTATDAFDYTSVAIGTQTLSFGGTNANNQVIIIPIIDDIIIEDTEDFNVLLRNISTTLVNILANDTATVNIIDNDGNEGWPEDMTIEACDTIPPAEDISSTSACAINVVLNEVIEGQDDECATEYSITRTWSITDCVGNSREHVQVITIEDTVAPTFVEALPQDITVACNEVPEAAILTALDSCEPNIEVTFEEVTTNDENCATGYTVTRTWSASDCAGNMVNHTQVITVPPTGPIMASPYEEQVTILCGDVVPEAPELTFTGGCGNFEVVFNEEVEKASDSDDFMIIRTWEVTDSCGNTASFEQIIFVLQPQLEEVTIDICIEEEAIDLLNYLPEGFDANGEFMILEGEVTLNGSMFDPLDHQPGEYKIAYSSVGGECKYYVDFTVVVNTDCVPCGRDQIEISKAITPNGDGVNDKFEIRGVEFCQFTFDIMLFNRWGNMVAEIKDYQNTWGGESPSGSFGSSGMLPAGTYYYIINATDTETGKVLEPLNGYIYLGSN